MKKKFYIQIVRPIETVVTEWINENPILAMNIDDVRVTLLFEQYVLARSGVLSCVPVSQEIEPGYIFIRLHVVYWNRKQLTINNKPYTTFQTAIYFSRNKI